ncbi:hypothetical protein SB9_022 [Salmonella phage vB_SenS_SB9]|uniref:Uncharacterized protein n=1 Tax=Salmonella phage vB_SenS_SB9 TaxID=2588125 RepID=A0A514A1Y7_9CAUD|nr:hypothetical protein SB9_022 [Salmonella phage vB_SenS_SB9]
MYNMKTQNAKCKMQEVRFAPSQKKKKKINVLRNELYELKNLVKSMLNGNAPTITELP